MAPRKLKAAPAPPAEAPFDTHRLLADLRKGEPEAMTQAYRLTFGTEWGRLVLADILSLGGVGRRFGGSLTKNELAYHQGGHDHALEIMERAGYDPASAVLTVMTGLLEGRDDERSAQPEIDDYAEPLGPDDLPD